MTRVTPRAAGRAGAVPGRVSQGRLNAWLPAGLAAAVLAAPGVSWCQGAAPRRPAMVYEGPEIVISAPRAKIPPTLHIDGRINAILMRLLENSADARPPEPDQQDPGYQDLNKLSSPMGFLVKTRFTELGFLLTEALAGTADLNLRSKIVNVARSGRNPQVRAAALLAVAYNRDQMDRGLFQEALLTPGTDSKDITVRFGGLEALEVWSEGGPEHLRAALQEIGTASRMDLSVPMKVYAAGALLRLGDPSGRDVVIRHVDDPCWVARAMSYRYLGEFGTPDDFNRILFNLPRENNTFVQAEMAGALLRLHALRSGGSQR